MSALTNHGVRSRFLYIVFAVSIFSFSSMVSCTMAGVIWILPGSTARHLVFRIGRWRDDYKPIRVRYVGVWRWRAPDSDREETYWLTAPAEHGDSLPRLTQFEYGSVTVGMPTNAAAAKPLTEGRYVVTISLEGGRNALMHFKVNSDGSVATEDDR